MYLHLLCNLYRLISDSSVQLPIVFVPTNNFDRKKRVCFAQFLLPCVIDNWYDRLFFQYWLSPVSIAEFYGDSLSLQKAAHLIESLPGSSLTHLCISCPRLE